MCAYLAKCVVNISRKCSYFILLPHLYKLYLPCHKAWKQPLQKPTESRRSPIARIHCSLFISAFFVVFKKKILFLSFFGVFKLNISNRINSLLISRAKCNLLSFNTQWRCSICEWLFFFCFLLIHIWFRHIVFCYLAMFSSDSLFFCRPAMLKNPTFCQEISRCHAICKCCFFSHTAFLKPTVFHIVVVVVDVAVIDVECWKKAKKLNVESKLFSSLNMMLFTSFCLKCFQFLSVHFACMQYVNELLFFLHVYSSAWLLEPFMNMDGHGESIQKKGMSKKKLHV